MSKKSLVALAHGLDVQENVTRVFDMMGGAAKMIEPNSTVVLKPNAGHAAPPEFAVCTHPETVRAVIREVKKANPKRIVIAEAAAVGCDTDECYEACGIAAVAREEGVELVDIKKDGSRQTFDKSKLLNGMIRACEKRPVPFGKLEEIPNALEQLSKSDLDREFPSAKIGELVMDRLREVDEVAYVRFASVYQQFADVESFFNELKKLMGDRKEPQK